MRLGPILAALIVCTLVAILTGQRAGGFMLYFVVPFLLLWILYSGYVSWKHPERRGLHAILTAIWLITIGSVASLHIYWHRTARNSAETIVRAVEKYKEQFGTYPTTAEAAGVDLEPNGGEWRIFYSADSGNPSLVYWDTFQVFSYYSYDFDRHSWVHLVD